MAKLETWRDGKLRRAESAADPLDPCWCVFVWGRYVGTLRAADMDAAIDLAAVRYDGGRDAGIQVTIEGDF